MKHLLLLFTLCTSLAAQTTGQWELRKKTATGMQSYGLTAVNGQAIGFSGGVPAMLPITAGSAWADITGKPSTFPPDAHNQAWSTITSTPTTLAGYGITDALTAATADSTYLPLSRTTTGGLGTGDANKAPLYDGFGQLWSRAYTANEAATAVATKVLYNGINFTTSIVDSTSLRATSGSSVFLLPGLASGTYNLISTGDTGTVTGTMIANNTISLTTKVTGTLPVANGGTGITALGTGVATALGVNTGASGAFVVNGGALGTPSSGTLTNCTSLPVSGITASTSAALGLGSVELGHATDTTISRVSAGVASIEGATIATLTAANTFTQTMSVPGITGTGGGGLYLLINGNSTSGSMIGVSGYMPGLTVGSAGGIGFSSGAPSSGYDTVMRRAAAGILALTTSTASTGAALQFRTQTAPGSAPSANQANVWLEDNGSGKLRLMVRFPTGAAQQIAIEP